MKHIVVIVLAVCLCFQAVVKISIIAWYQANKTYVATVLCENKAKPELNCCGKCYLNKQLKKAEPPASDQQKQLVKLEKTELIAILNDGLHIPFRVPAIDTQFGDSYQPSVGIDAVKSVFHPPPAFAV